MEGLILFIIIIIFVLSIWFIVKLEKHEVVYVKSSFDNEEYLVRDLPDKEQAANLLAMLKKNIFTLKNHLYENKDNKYKENRENIEQLYNNLQHTVINESNGSSEYTSYSVNKGEQIVFCLRSKYDNQLHDLNLLMYVGLHELAHVGCKEYGHTPLFKKIFAFYTNVAIELNLYNKISFNSDPIEYCGLIISESII